MVHLSNTYRSRDDIVMDYANGHLSPARHILVTCQSEISQDVANDIAMHETLAATLLDKVKPQALDPLFIGNVLARLPEQGTRPVPEPVNDRGVFAGTHMAPKTLREMLGHGLRDLKWKHYVPGVAVHDIIGDRTFGSERLYLLRAKSGMKMPPHSHNGEEWTLILKGSYTVDGKRFARGDLHVESEDTTHAPVIDEGEDCICLVVTEGPLQMKGWLARIVQPFIGI